MGKLLVPVIFVIVVVAVMVIVSTFLEDRRLGARAGLKRTKKQLAALKAADTRHVAALKEIRDLATASETLGGDPLWTRVNDVIDVALGDRNERDTT